MPLFQPGAHFAQHTILRLVGTGHVAEVYEVVAEGGRRRALKLLKDGVALGAKSHARLGQEAEAVASIEHVNVVRFYDAGVEHGRVWILLELVEGPDLRRLVQEAGGALPVERAVRIVRQACEGVAAAHALGILHRDLSPENILVAPDDVAKVADFGSAKLGDYGVKTTSEQDVASSLYMAPEFMTSRVAWPCSDVYSMGLVLYEIIAGVHPIAPRSATAMEICRRQLAHEPPPLATLGRDVPGDLSDLVQRALAKDPARRMLMRELADGLAVVLQRLHAQRRAAARSLPLPNREQGLALTELAMPAFGAGGTVPMAAYPGPAAPGGAPGREAGPAPAGPSVPVGEAASSRPASPRAEDRAALPPPAPASMPVTLRSPSDPRPAPVAVTPIEAAPVAERASTSIPVERPTAPRREEPRPRRRAIGVGVVVLTVGGLGAGWLLVGRGAVAPASAPPPAPSVSAVPSATASTAGTAPTAEASAARPGVTAAPARARELPRRLRRP